MTDDSHTHRKTDTHIWLATSQLKEICPTAPSASTPNSLCIRLLVVTLCVCAWFFACVYSCGSFLMCKFCKSKEPFPLFLHVYDFIRHINAEQRELAQLYRVITVRNDSLAD